MPKPSLKAEFKNFSRGLFTEYSELNFPENAFQDGLNFEVQRDGSLNRRNGMDVEITDSGLFNTDIFQSSVNTGNYSITKWESAGGSPEFDFVVVQVSSKLYVFNTTEETLTEGGIRATINLATIAGKDRYNVVPVKGALVVACGSKDIALVKFDPTTEVFTTSYFRIKTRDFWGIPYQSVPQYDTDPQYRGADDLGHIYNLYNQSWGLPRKNKDGNLKDPLFLYKSEYGVLPSNSETVWPGMQYQASSTPFERMYTNLYQEVLGADNRAAKGYFIIDALDRGSSRTQALADNNARNPTMTYTSIPMAVDSTTTGATIVAEFAGRVVYAGFGGEVTGSTNRSPNLTDHIFFSQLINNERDYSKCYQEGDPTSRESADVVDTDGGFIRIAGAKQIVALRVLNESLIVLASNGVWVVRGGNDEGFKATNYKVEKVTVFGCIGPRSVVDDGDQLLYWSGDGIYNVVLNQGNVFTATCLSEKSIQTFYNNIDAVSKADSVGVYDTFAKKIRWIYHTTSSRFSGSHELVLDMVLGSFYPISINNPDYGVVGAVSLPTYRISQLSTDVEVGGEIVLSGTDVVTVGESTAIQNVQSLRYLVMRKSTSIARYSFAYYRNTSFKDWNTDDASAYITTADFTNNDSSTNKQVPWVTTHMRRTETGISNGDLVNPSGCKLSSRWDWSISGAANKWSSPQQIYRPRVYMTSSGYDPGTRIITTKNKMRGMGKAINLRFETEVDKDCKIVGWSVALNGNAIV